MRANRDQLDRLLEWAAEWPERTWAVENATGLGRLLAQQLLAAGEAVLDVPPKLAAKARLLSDGDTNKNDPNDARSVAVAGLRSAKVRPAAREDYSAVMGMWSDRYLELAAARTQVVCRLHAVLCELIPGGIPACLRATAAQQVLEEIEPASPADHARLALAWQLLGDLLRIDGQRRETKKHMSLAVTGVGHDAHRGVRGRPVRGLRGQRPRRRHQPLRQPGRVRRLQRHRPGRSVVRGEEDLPAVQAR